MSTVMFNLRHNLYKNIKYVLVSIKEINTFLYFEKCVFLFIYFLHYISVYRKLNIVLEVVVNVYKFKNNIRKLRLCENFRLTIISETYLHTYYVSFCLLHITLC